MMKKRKYTPFQIFCMAITLFYIVFTRLIVKTDDGHFLGIMSENGFNLPDWLRMRYETISGRVVCEFLTMSFLKTDLTVWKICAALIWIAVVYFIMKLLRSFSEKGNDGIAVCIPFLAFIGCLNPAAFWFSGSLTYLFPFGCMVITLIPTVFDLMKIEYRRIPWLILSAVSALVACSQEQSAALTLGFYAVVLIALIAAKRIKAYHFISLPFCIFQTYVLFSSPGMSGRMEAEAGGFDRFEELGVFGKILCGLSNYYAFGFMMSAAVFAFFIIAVILKIKSLYSAKTMPILLAVFSVLSLIGGNALSLAFCRAVPDKAFEKMFASGKFNAVGIAVIIVCTLTLLLIAASLIMIALRDKKTGLSALTCYTAGVCSAVVLGFSPSIYASGQRVFFFAEMLTLISAAILLTASADSRGKRITESAARIISAVMLLLNCLSWFFMEIPIMG